MIILILFAFIAGIVTVLSPCIFPVLPILLAGSVGQGKRRPSGIITGFILSFTFFTLALSAIVALTGLSADALRGGAIALIAVFGLFLLIPQWQFYFEKFVPRFPPSPKSNQQKTGFSSGVIVGASLGLVWTPCVGPILASVITLAAANKITIATLGITLAYASGTALPMFAVMQGGRTLTRKASWFKSKGVLLQRGFGVLMILLAIALGLGFDRKFEAWILTKAPDYAIKLISIDDNPRVQSELEKLR